MLNLDAQYLSEEHQQFRDQLRNFVSNEIVPHAAAWEEVGFVPKEIYQKMGELGYLGLAAPEEFGGSQLDEMATVIFGEELARSGFGGFTASITDHADMAIPVIVRVGNQDQKERFLPDLVAGKRILGFAVTEPGGGSDLSRMKTTAVKDGDDWVLNGQKTFITNALSADIFITVAKTDPDANGANGYSLFIIEKGGKGFSTGAKFDKTGWCSSDMSELFFDDFRVPAKNQMGEEGKGFYLLMQGLERERLSMGAQCIGLMEQALKITLEHVKERAAYGKTLWDLQAIKHELAAHASDLSAAKLLVYHAAAKKSRGESVRLETSMLKARVPELLKRMVSDCVQLHGASGYMRGTEIERIGRDTRPLSLGGGAAAVMLDEVAKLL